jgi:hypothetical protein
LGNLSKQVGKENTGANSEVYCCPQGFSGTYKVLVRRAWGQVTANRVRVEVCTHFLTDKEKRLAQWIDLDSGEAAMQVVFDLADGRRTDSLHDHQVANAAMPHLALRQQVLAQQLAATVDTGAQGSYYSSQQSALGGAGVNPMVPFAGLGAVGYQPQITMIPEGAMLMARAIISADRRFVRISPSPNFMQIKKVDTFNFATGATNTTSQAGTQGGLGGAIGTSSGSFGGTGGIQ